MKSIIKYIIGGMGLLSITSCSDFLDQSSPSEIKGDMVFNSLTFTEQSLNKVYAGLTLDHTYGARIPLNFGFNTDIELVDADVNKPASFTESSERALGNYNGESISGSWSKLDDNWKNCFAIIEDANLVVEGIRSSELFQEGNPARNKMCLGLFRPFKKLWRPAIEIRNDHGRRFQFICNQKRPRRHHGTIAERLGRSCKLSPLGRRIRLYDRTCHCRFCSRLVRPHRPCQSRLQYPRILQTRL